MTRRVLTVITLLIVAWLASAPTAQESIQIGGPIFQGLDNNGDPCDGCKLYVFTSGSQTAASTYTTRARNTSHTSPVVLDAAGRAVVFVDASGIYDVRLDSPADVTIWTMLGVGEPVQDASGLTSTAGIDVELDTDNNTSNAAFRILNGLDSAVFSVTEAGVFSPTLTGLASLGCTGTRNSGTVLYGDCTWAEIPTQYLVALNTGSSTTTASTFTTVGDSLTFPVTTGGVTLRLIGVNRHVMRAAQSGSHSYPCHTQVINTTTNTTFSTTTGTIRNTTLSGLTSHVVFGAYEIIDSSPMQNSDNVYEVQISRSSSLWAPGGCLWSTDNSSRGFYNGGRGLIAFSS